MKKILLINGHPNPNSFCTFLAKAYQDEDQNLNVDISVVNVHDLNFDPLLRFGFQKEQPPEPDLIQVQNEIKNADHIVLIYPNWWGMPPALFKGFIDRVFLPGFAFKYNGGSFPEKLLKGKTSEVILTLDTPWWYYRFFMGSPGLKIVTRDVLAFCGIKNLRTTLLGPITGSTETKRKLFIEKVKQLSRNL